MNIIKQIETQLINGDLDIVLNNLDNINNEIVILMNKTDLDNNDIEVLRSLIHIGNIVYNNTDLGDDRQPIENGVYDLLLERYKVYDPSFQVGAEPIMLNNTSIVAKEIIDIIPMITVMDSSGYENMLWSDELLETPKITKQDLVRPMISVMYEDTSRRSRDVIHSNPGLVGSLDKCKYVLNSQAIEKGVFDDDSVKILERDFFNIHLQRGLINTETILKIMLELKYDGASAVVSIVNGMVVKAESRGDTGTGKTTDLTSLLYGYTFPHLPKNVSIDCKCEAIMTYKDLYYYNLQRGKDYKNCRSAINGLFALGEGYQYQEFITLVPLKIESSSIDPNGILEPVDRVTEIEFMNKYLRKGEILRHAYIEGTYNEILFMIKKFVEEAEFVRDIMPCMYDGVVVSYVDEDMINILGRENSINKYSMAIKFNALKKQTRFKGYTFTIGQDGTITPMAHYDPVEFFGTIHPKSSVSSYNRFNNLSLKVGDIIEVEYRHDVMPYVTKPDLDHNYDNPNPIIPFIIDCPSCHSDLQLSTSGKSCKCINIECPERNIQRISNMMDKLDLKDFAEANMEKIGKYSLTELMSLDVEELKPILGDVTSYKFMERMDHLRNSNLYDFEIVGALGFTGIAQDTWKKIFNKYTLEEVISMGTYCTGSGGFEALYAGLSTIKGIGPMTIDTIANEFDFFYKDLFTISKMSNVASSKGIVRRKIRMTGFRDKDLMMELQDLGYDASDGSVTKDTYILLVPKEGHSSSKVERVGPDTLVIPVGEFKDNKNKYL